MTVRRLNVPLGPVRKRPAPPALPRWPLLFTLAAVALAALPTLGRVPAWLAVLLVGLLVWRALIALRDWQQPPLALLIVAALGVGWALTGEYGTLAGRDGGTAFLAILIALKANETRTRRDALLLALLGYFLTATHFFFAQDATVALHALLACLALTASIVWWRRPAGAGAGVDPRPQLRQAGVLLLQAAPLAVALFVLFPRPAGPLWQVPVGSSRNQTGLSDSVTPGAYANLAQDDAVAFRASFAGALPPPEDLYWRGPVLEAFDGRSWRRAPAQPGLPSTQALSAVRRYTLTLEPSGQPWVLALDAPASLPPGTGIDANLQVSATGPIGTRTRFEMTAVTRYQYGLDAPQAQLDYDTRLPAGGNPRARALAASWAHLPPQARVDAAIRLFSTGGYSYTLNPPTLPPNDPIDALLFGTRLGFCEYYAGAFAYLMRAAGVPARLVGGYLGGEQNGPREAPYLIIRQADAHAWTEVWLAGRGWVRVDPTALVAPARLTEGLGAALPDSPELPALLRPGGTALRGLALRLDALQNAWNTWVIGYDGARQRSLLTRLGIGEAGGWRYGLALLGALALAAIPLVLVARARRAPEDPVRRAYVAYTRRLGLPLGEAEDPSEYAQRASALKPAEAPTIQAITHEYQALRYGSNPNVQQVRAFVRRAARA